MSKFLEFARNLLSPERLLKAREEAYLAEAVTIDDLERRMRELEGRRYG